MFVKEHYDRLLYTFKLNNKEVSLSFDEFLNSIYELVEKNNVSEGNVKVTYNIDFDILRYYFIDHSYPTEKMYADGVEAILFFGQRENPNAKIINKGFRDYVNSKIEARDAYEAILVGEWGVITEGSRSNIFVINGDTLRTSRVETVLPGVTRTEIIKMARELNIKVIEENINYMELKSADAVFMSGTSPKILPITKIEGNVINRDCELLNKLMEAFDNRIEKYISENSKKKKIEEKAKKEAEEKAKKEAKEKEKKEAEEKAKKEAEEKAKKEAEAKAKKEAKEKEKKEAEEKAKKEAEEKAKKEAEAKAKKEAEEKAKKEAEEKVNKEVTKRKEMALAKTSNTTKVNKDIKGSKVNKK